MSNGLHRRGGEHGAATLAVVMVLFFIMAMVSAYTNRNLVFEQRTSANSYRAARSLTAADAAADWAIAMLNGGTIDTTCSPTGATNDFRTRYLTVDPDGKFRPVTWPTIWLSGPATVQAQPSCSGMPGGGWACSCPTATPPALLSVANIDQPVFTVGFIDDSPPGVVGLKIRGCDSVRSGTVTPSNVNSMGSCHVNDLFTTDPDGKAYLAVDAMAMVRMSLGLVGALPVAPTAAVTVAGTIEQTAGSLKAINPDPLTGLALHAGGAVLSPTTVTVAGPAGSTSGATSAPDSDLSGIMGTDFFRRTLGMPADNYRQQPAATTVSCSPCTAASVLTELAKGPTRVIFVNGDLNLDVDATTPIGSDAIPAMVVVTGNVTVSQPIAFKGVIYAGGDLTWAATAANGLISGAVIVGGKYTGNGNAAFAYDRNIVQKIHKGYGSFVRVPGSWITES
jgi:hypothetical protein